MDLYRIECVDENWTVRSENGRETYYFGDSCKDCEDWIKEHNGEVIDIVAL